MQNNIEKNKIAKFAVKNHRKIFLIVVLLLMCATQAFSNILFSDFLAYNGDFQTYNPIRRVLDGQIPYVDFTNYIGMGVVFLNAPFIALSNTFTSSLFVTNFTAMFVFYACVITMFYITINNKDIAYAVSLLFIVAFSILQGQGAFFPFVTLDEPGISMRMERAFWPFLLCIIFILLAKKLKFDINIFKSTKFLIIGGFVLGLGAVWSNDYGFASMFAAFIIIAFLYFFVYKIKFWQTVKQLFVFGVFIVLGAILSVTIVTAGDPISFITNTLGISSHQFWYYGGEVKLLQFTNLIAYPRFIVYCAAMLLIFAYYFYKAYKKTIKIHDVLVCFILLVNLIAVVLYAYGIGKISDECFSFGVFFALVGIIINIVYEKTNYKSTAMLKAVSSVAVCVFVVFSAIALLHRVQMNNDYEYTSEYQYMPELAGYNENAQVLYRMSETIGDESVFSTYSSALELVLGQFQPSGYDYGMHVLGDDAREEYLDDFLNNDYEFATTLSFTDEYSVTETWMKRANWYWYKHLLANYSPVDYGEYNILWQKTDESMAYTPEIDLTYNKLSEYSYEIIVVGDLPDGTMIDVEIAYKSDYIFNLERINTFRKIVQVKDESMLLENANRVSHYGIAENSEALCVPITMHGGVGRIEITSKPIECTVLELYRAKVINAIKPSSQN